MIKEKLEILVSSEVIDEDTRSYVLKVLEYLLENKIINDVSQADVFLTHLAMADMRRKKNEAVASLDEFILSEISADPKFMHSKELWQDLEKMAEKKFEEAELDYFYLHIINLLKED
ncbi:MAG: PRD domain-containing protein [Vagococcus sp.]|uniref:PRD domain-containing protein n=1 Tax=Vagococcus sp. TaxID=1933889 RepID=UPI002FCC8446